MKIDRKTPGFEPVTITLETIGEVAALAAALLHGTPRELKETAGSCYGPAVGAAVAPVASSISFGLWDKLDDIALESKCLLS